MKSLAFLVNATGQPGNVYYYTPRSTPPSKAFQLALCPSWQPRHRKYHQQPGHVSAHTRTCSRAGSRRLRGRWQRRLHERTEMRHLDRRLRRGRRFGLPCHAANFVRGACFDACRRADELFAGVAVDRRINFGAAPDNQHLRDHASANAWTQTRAAGFATAHKQE